MATISTRLRDDTDVVRTALANDGERRKWYHSKKPPALSHASERLRDDYAIVQIAVVKKGIKALEHASERLRNDPGLVALASGRPAMRCACFRSGCFAPRASPMCRTT